VDCTDKGPFGACFDWVYLGPDEFLAFTVLETLDGFDEGTPVSSFVVVSSADDRTVRGEPTNW
jgi:hypothetical protein